MSSEKIKLALSRKLLWWVATALICLPAALLVAFGASNPTLASIGVLAIAAPVSNGLFGSGLPERASPAWVATTVTPIIILIALAWLCGAPILLELRPQKGAIPLLDALLLWLIYTSLIVLAEAITKLIKEWRKWYSDGGKFRERRKAIRAHRNSELRQVNLERKGQAIEEELRVEKEFSKSAQEAAAE